MRRRVFLSATSTFGIAGVASGSSVVSSIYTRISEHVSLAEFSSSSKSILDHFISELTLNIREHDLKEDYIASVAIPIIIIKKDYNNGQERIVYKNKAGNFIELSMKNGREIIRITNTY